MFFALFALRSDHICNEPVVAVVAPSSYPSSSETSASFLPVSVYWYDKLNDVSRENAGLVEMDFMTGISSLTIDGADGEEEAVKENGHNSAKLDDVGSFFSILLDDDSQYVRAIEATRFFVRACYGYQRPEQLRLQIFPNQLLVTVSMASAIGCFGLASISGGVVVALLGTVLRGLSVSFAKGRRHTSTERSFDGSAAATAGDAGRQRYRREGGPVTRSMTREAKREK